MRRDRRSDHERKTEDHSDCRAIVFGQDDICQKAVCAAAGKWAAAIVHGDG